MKKTFLLALVLCLVSGFVFASVTTTLQLNLNDATSRLHAGFYDAAEITIGITPSTTSASAIDISKDDANLTTNQKTFCIFWYMNAIQDAGESATLSLTLNPLKATDPAHDDVLNYEIVVGEAIRTGVQTYNILLTEGTRRTIDSDDIELPIFDANDNYAGLSTGFIPITIPATDFTSVHKDIYQATLSLTITAP